MASSDASSLLARPRGVGAPRVPVREWLAATLRLGWLLYRRDNPTRPVVVASLFRNLADCLLYTLLGVVTGGAAGGDYSFVGAVVLVTCFYTLAQMSDVPMRDKIDGTYPRLSRAPGAPLAAFVVRGLPVLGAGLVAAVVSGVVVGALTGRLGVLAQMAPAAPLLLAAGLSGSVAGLVIIAPAIGTRYDTLTYNTMNVLVVVFSGALIPTGTHGALDAIGAVLPLTHAIAGVRAAMVGTPWGGDLLAELAVGAGWALAAVVVYRLMDRRGRTTGRGAFTS